MSYTLLVMFASPIQRLCQLYFLDHEPSIAPRVDSCSRIKLIQLVVGKYLEAFQRQISNLKVTWIVCYLDKVLVEMDHDDVHLMGVMGALIDLSTGILSALVFQEKTNNEPPLTDRLKAAVDQVRRGVRLASLWCRRVSRRICRAVGVSIMGCRYMIPVPVPVRFVGGMEICPRHFLISVVRCSAVYRFLAIPLFGRSSLLLLELKKVLKVSAYATRSTRAWMVSVSCPLESSSMLYPTWGFC